MANVYAELIRLLPTTDTLVGKILSVNVLSGTAVVSSLVGGTHIVSMGKGSSYSVGDWVLTRDSNIVTTIPIPQGENTPEVPKSIEIY